jgi:hypothetical protein
MDATWEGIETRLTRHSMKPDPEVRQGLRDSAFVKADICIRRSTGIPSACLAAEDHLSMAFPQGRLIRSRKLQLAPNIIVPFYFFE